MMSRVIIYYIFCIILQVGNMKMYCLSFCFYCKDKRGIVGNLKLVL